MIFESFQTFSDSALQSDFFAGGVALGAFGAVIAVLRILCAKISTFMRRRIWVSLTLDNQNSAYRYLCIWMEETGVFKRSKHLRMTDSGWSRGTKGYAPGSGRHWFISGGRLCYLYRDVSDRTKVGRSHNQRLMETLTVKVLFGSVSTVLGWVDAGKEISERKDHEGPKIHLLKGDYWDEMGSLPERDLDSVLVDDNRIKDMVADMRWFYDAQEWYAQRGVPWRRGYLLYGPPGTGKSSLIRALATELNKDVASLDVARTGLSDDDLRDAFLEVPKNAIIAIEDIDAVFVKRGDGDRRSSVSFSGLLNAIDGIASQEGRTLVMTTNHKEKLDPALIRDGRADVHLELGYVNAHTAGRLFDRFFPNHPEHRDVFCRNLKGMALNPSATQGWLLTNWNDIDKAASGVGLLPKEMQIAAQ